MVSRCRRVFLSGGRFGVCRDRLHDEVTSDDTAYLSGTPQQWPQTDPILNKTPVTHADNSPRKHEAYFQQTQDFESILV